MIWPCVFSGDDGHVRVCVCGGGNDGNDNLGKGAGPKLGRGEPSWDLGTEVKN